ncbi:nickel pincer cofactor biosynthesis protein LarC [Bacillus piscicola]|uniref:nickel pincer cofactor biosynthesis protein LarC n=1 Tax=Bacillus piscicola TaxID=1632684 RepID=UPI001F094D35|nr:nickel pincer cofactor biosynthesis protein LarC [Bacillus piscicola]
MTHLFLDCQYGISGDMTLSALIDLGADVSYISEQLKQLPIESFTMDVSTVNKKGIAAQRLELKIYDAHPPHSHNHHHDHDHHHHHDHDHPHRKAASILEMITNSRLPLRVKERSSAVFQVIAEAEGKIHGMDPEDVHFHEVGAMDSIIDVIGVCLALESLGVDKITTSPVPTGYGKMKMAHGLYPIPAPATAEILKGVPLLDFHVEGELTTPTGAGFLQALADEYGYLPARTIKKIGYGAGCKDFEHPNVLRAILLQEEYDPGQEIISTVECQVDDMTGEALGYVMEKGFAAGALDIYYTPVTMKKSRPGCLITVLAKPKDARKIEELLLRETSTFGVRRTAWDRKILARDSKEVQTPFGSITVKLGYMEGQLLKAVPEYEEVKRAADANNVPFMEVYGAAQEAATKLL